MSQSRSDAGDFVVERVEVEAESAAPAMPRGTAAAFEEPAAEFGAEPGEAVERLIIRTGSIAIDVEDPRAARAEIEQMVASMAAQGAFVVSSQEYGGQDDSLPNISMSIRVPAVRFEEVMDRLAELAVNVDSRSESAEDVTEEYVDLEARLESLEAARDRLLEIMAEARTTEDLLRAEEQLTQREAEIESIKGRMQYLEQSARLSSIWIELRPHILSQPVGETWRPAETVRRAFDALVNGLQGFGNFLIYFAIAVLPWLLLIVLIVYLVVRLVLWRTRASRKTRAAQRDRERSELKTEQGSDDGGSDQTATL
jgi:hypothetical protein